MDAAGAAFQGNVVADDHQRGPVDKRMGGLHVFQILALNGSYDLISGFPAAFIADSYKASAIT